MAFRVYFRSMETTQHSFDNAPIGIFDSGLGGFTVAREIVAALPHESIVYAGDTARCPYGPRDQREVDAFVQQICSWLVARGVKLIVIACNTATAAGLAHAQRTMPVPVIGVVEPGARAATMTTLTRRVGVVATQGTIDSGAYERAINNIDAGIEVFSAPTQRFVEIAEQGLRGQDERFATYEELVARGFDSADYRALAEGYLAPFREKRVDTLVLGCTHFPLLAGLIGQAMGPGVQLISSATETARDVAEILRRRRAFAAPDHRPSYQFFTSGADCEEFARLGTLVLNVEADRIETVDFGELHLEELRAAKEAVVEKKVVIATNNAHKVSEITTALDFEGWHYSTLRDAGLVSNPVEDADNFEGNARIKARAAHELSGGLAALADDSGLVVDALGGDPGVFSSRYAGEDGNDAANNEKLLRELGDLPFDERTARFVCTLVFIDEDGSETVARGTIEGKIGFEEKGSGGFGYDPLFYPDFYEGRLTLAEVPQEDKNAISHRGNALRQLKELLGEK